MHRIASWPPGVWALSRSLHHMDRWVLTLSRGKATLTNILAGAPMVTVTTTGAKSGLPRTLPLVCVRDPLGSASFALIATNWGRERFPAWYHNLKANPRAVCAFDGAGQAYTAREAEGEEYARYWELALEIYPGYRLYKERIQTRRIPILVMTPECPD